MGEFFEMQEDGLLDEFGEYIGPMPTDEDMGLTFKCDICGKAFGSANAVSQHKRDTFRHCKD